MYCQDHYFLICRSSYSKIYINNLKFKKYDANKTMQKFLLIQSCWADLSSITTSSLIASSIYTFINHTIMTIIYTIANQWRVDAFLVFTLPVGLPVTPTLNYAIYLVTSVLAIVDAVAYFWPWKTIPAVPTSKFIRRVLL